jgi:hypothetical protein
MHLIVVGSIIIIMMNIYCQNQGAAAESVWDDVGSGSQQHRFRPTIRSQRSSSFFFFLADNSYGAVVVVAAAAGPCGGDGSCCCRCRLRFKLLVVLIDC